MRQALSPPKDISVQRSPLLQLAVQPLDRSGKIPRIRCNCHHSMFRREIVNCGDAVLWTRTHWRIADEPSKPQHCTRCSHWGRRLPKALLCALDKHLIFPGSPVALCEGANQALLHYATRVNERFVCCATCAGSARRVIGIWNGKTITPS